MNTPSVSKTNGGCNSATSIKEEIIKRQSNKYNRKALMKLFIKCLKTGLTIKGHVRSNWHEETYRNIVRIWEGKELEPELRQRVLNWRRDGRNPEQFFLEVVVNWIGEDYVIKSIRSDEVLNAKYEVILNGNDYERRVTESKNTKQAPDLILKEINTGKKIFIEIVESNSFYWKEESKHDLRFAGQYSKYDSLLESNKELETYLLCIDFFNDKIAIIPIKDMVVLQKKRWKTEWKKYTTEIDLEYNKNFVDISKFREKMLEIIK